jgi:hypothetical protein
MGASDVFPWLPNWKAPVTINYRFDTVINSSEPGAEQSRIPLYSTVKRSISCSMFSPKYMPAIENFVRRMHADFFMSPIFTEPIYPIGTIGESLSGATSIATDPGLLNKFNFSNLCNRVVLIDSTNYDSFELHTLESHSNSGMVISGPVVSNFYIGRTIIFPCMRAYINNFFDNIATTTLSDTDVVFEEYF